MGETVYMCVLIGYYRASEKGAYMHVLADIYKALSVADFDDVQKAFREIEV